MNNLFKIELLKKYRIIIIEQSNMLEIKKYIEKKNDIQQNLIEFIDDDSNREFYLYQLNILLHDQQVTRDRYELISLVHLISRILDYHHRTPTFFTKIEQVILLFKSEIRKSLSNSQIFNIFKSNKRIILFLIEEGIIKPDKNIAKLLIQEEFFNSKYPIYFYNEFSNFFKENITDFKDDIEELNKDTNEYIQEKRKIGENHHHLSELIRNDSIEEFISFTNKTNLPLSTTIKPSIYETNLFLFQNTPTLIEYCVFFGSIQIFQYLILNNIEMTSSLWIYAIHGKNPEIIHILEENHVVPDDPTFKECLFESIKCHHNEITNYILNNLFRNHQDDELSIFSMAIEYNNYEFFPENLNNLFFLDELCKFDYVPIVNLLINRKNINSRIISKNKIFFLIKFLFNCLFLIELLMIFLIEFLT